LNLVRNRRTFVGLAILATVSGLATACGVKGPLYLPEEQETEEEKGKDEKKTSRHPPAPGHATNG
jgi:predicted small lipoprotein YifL